jgi:hypothetical protein
LIAHGYKDTEHRTWSSAPQTLAIHAGARKPLDPGDGEDEPLRGLALPLGCIVAVADVVGCERTEDGYGWVLRNVRRLAKPVPCRGAQGLWDLPPELLAAVERQLG